MERRSAVSTLTAAIAGLALGKLPDLSASTVPVRGAPLPEPPESSGFSECPECNTSWDQLTITPAGICLSCAVQANPSPTAVPHSDPFWVPDANARARLEVEMHRLAREAQALIDAVPDDEWNESLSEQVMQALDKVTTIQREALLLHMLHAASLQFAPFCR